MYKNINYKNLYNDVWRAYKKFIKPMQLRDNANKWAWLDEMQEIMTKYKGVQFADDLLTAAHYELMAIYDGKATGHADYLAIYKDTCDLFKKYYPTEEKARNNENYWRNLINEASDISIKHHDSRFCNKLLFAATDEIERTSKISN